MAGRPYLAFPIDCFTIYRHEVRANSYTSILYHVPNLVKNVLRLIQYHFVLCSSVPSIEHPLFYKWRIFFDRFLYDHIFTPTTFLLFPLPIFFDSQSIWQTSVPLTLNIRVISHSLTHILHGYDAHQVWILCSSLDSYRPPQRNINTYSVINIIQVIGYRISVFL